MIHPHIMYCLNIYSMAHKTTLKPIEIKRKEAMRLISNVNYRAHTKDLFLLHEILPFERLIKLERQKFMHKFYHKKQPITFSDLWILNLDRNPDLALRNANNYIVPVHNTEILQRSPLTTFAKAWNEATDSKFNPSLSVFLKDPVKVHLTELRV